MVSRVSVHGLGLVMTQYVTVGSMWQKRPGHFMLARKQREKRSRVPMSLPEACLQ
jgi:hypothetical protein